MAMLNRLLVVDDARLIRRELSGLLAQRYIVREAESGQQCLDLIEEFDPELILLDYHLPDLEGPAICAEIRGRYPHKAIQILIFSSDENEQARLEAFSAGADDFVAKTIRRTELTAKIEVQLRLRSALTRAVEAEKKLDNYNKELERVIDARAVAIQATQDIAVFALAKLADSRDTETGEHLIRMRAYAQILAEHLRHEDPYVEVINEQFLNDLYRSSPLHDIGKVGISDAILLKPAKLTTDEFEVMKSHASIGANTLDEAATSGPSGSFFHMAAQIARYHHERWDGSGYPEGLKGTDIPLPARIVAVADVFDALTSRRVYKEAMPPEEAKALILSEKGKHFDPAVVEAFEKVYDEFLLIAADQNERSYFSHATRPGGARHLCGMEMAKMANPTGEKVLIVQHDSAILHLISNWLERSSYRVRSCGDIKTATQMIQEDCPRFVITDWKMDHGDGETLCRWIRDEHLPEYVYTIVVPSHGNSETMLEAYQAGADDFLSTSTCREELLARLKAASRVVDLENQLRKIARNDPLTGLATRRYLDEQLRREWYRTCRYRLPLSCLLLDIDDFDGINRERGYTGGDAVLQQVARLVEGTMRMSDYTCRLPGDKIMVILPELTEIQAYQFAEKLRDRIQRTSYQIGDEAIHITASFGVAQNMADTKNLDALLSLTEECLTVAKKFGKNRVVSRDELRDTLSLGSCPQEAIAPLGNVLANEVMHPVFCMRESFTIREAIRFLLRHRLNCAPVVDVQGKLVGIVSEKDLMPLLTKRFHLEESVSSAMRRDVIFFNEDDPAGKVFEFLAQAAIRRVIVVRDGQPSGVITRTSFLHWFNQQLAAHAAPDLLLSRPIPSLENEEGIEIPLGDETLEPGGQFALRNIETYLRSIENRDENTYQGQVGEFSIRE